MTDPNQRRMNWEIKTDTTRMKETLDTLRPDMLKVSSVSFILVVSVFISQFIRR